MNPSKPRVQRRLASLRTSFEARGRQQRRKYERALRDASEIGRLHALGDMMGIYAEKRSDNGRGWGIFLFLLILLCGIGGGQVSVRLLRALPPAQLPMSVAIIAGLIAALVALLVFSWWLMRRQPTYAWIYAYAEGLAVPGRRGGSPDLVSRDAIESLYNVWQNICNPVSEESEPRFVGYRVRLTDGRELTFPLSYRNMLDLHAAIRPVLSGLLPSPVVETMLTYPTLGEVLERSVVQRKLPEMLRTFRGGHPVDFGELRLDALGLVTDQGRKTLLWSDVQSITPEQGTIVIKQNDHRSAWAEFPVTEMPNAVVFFALLAQTPGRADHSSLTQKVRSREYPSLDLVLPPICARQHV
ncbi:MAG TPA: DUF6585 family protein [Ktedonobacterales bacterium]|nr:DUF6585 family protein [Ktedonobacterales bacterium]